MKPETKKFIKAAFGIFTVLSLILSTIIISEANTYDGYGTYEDGMAKEIITRDMTPIETHENLDFEDGFRYWGTYWNNSVASDFAEIVKENGNTSVKLKPNANDGTSGFKGISTAAFYLDNVNVNDKLTLIYDYKGDTDFSVQLLQITKQGEYHRLVGAGPTANGTIESDAPEGFSTTWGQIQNSVVADNTNGGKFAFYIVVAPVGNVNIESYIDNIRIVKRGTDDGYGTYGNGMAKEIITRDMTPIATYKNLDFEEGFRYWGTYWNNSVASDFAEIVRENGNNSVKLKPNANDGSGGWRGISTAAFYLDNVNVNDKLTLIYDYKGDTDFSVQLLQITKQGEYRRLVGAGPTANGIINGNAPKGFSTTWGQIQNSVVADNTDDGKFAFYIIVAPTGNVNIESYIDNIRIVKRGTNRDFYTLDGEPYDPYTSDTDGIDQSAPEVKWETSELKAPGDSFNLPNITQGGGKSPVIGELSKEVKPGNSITVMGENFSYANTKAYYVSNGGTKEAKSIVVADNQMELTIDSAEEYGTYGIYIKNDNGTSALRMVNAPKVWWTGLSDVNAGDEFCIYGENLSFGNSSQSNVYLIDGNKWYKMEVTFADPFKVTVKIPKGLVNNKTYTLKLHNGSGGEYTWTDVTEKITYKTPKINGWKGNVINVTEYGADAADSNDDTNAIKNAIAAASGGETIYFPEGTYTINSAIEVGVPVYFKGDGADKTKIVIGSKMKDEAMLDLLVGPSEFYGIAFEDVRKDQYKTSFIQYKGDRYISGSYNLYVHNCKFLQSTKPVARSWKPAIVARAATGIVIENNYFEVTSLIFASSVEKLFVRNNEVCGVSYCGPYYDQNCLLLWNTHMYDASNNKLYGKDLLTDNSGTMVNNDLTIGRAFALQQGGSNAYISHNSMERVGLPDDNAGEQIMLEDVKNIYLGSITAAAKNSVTLSGIATVSPTTKSIVTIVKGKGAGQYRYVKSVTSKTITVAEDWAITPDTSSEIMISNSFDNFAIYNNEMDAFKNHYEAYTATTGVQVYGNTHNIFIMNNKFSNMCAGVCVTSHYRYNDKPGETNGVYWAQIDNNVISNCSEGIRFKLSHMVTPKQKEITMYTAFGITMRNNVIKDSIDYKFSSRAGLGGIGIYVGTRMHTYVNQPYFVTWQGEWEYGTLIENNKISNSEKYNILLCRHQGYTVLRNNTVAGSISELYGIDEECDYPIDNPIIYR